MVASIKNNIYIINWTVTVLCDCEVSVMLYFVADERLSDRSSSGRSFTAVLWSSTAPPHGNIPSLKVGVRRLLVFVFFSERKAFSNAPRVRFRSAPDFWGRWGHLHTKPQRLRDDHGAGEISNTSRGLPQVHSSRLDQSLFSLSCFRASACGFTPSVTC